MIVQLRGAAFVNKGAELMLLAVLQRLRDRWPTVRPCVNYTVGSPAQRRALGLSEIVALEYHPTPGAKQLSNAIARMLASGRRVPDEPAADPAPPSTRAEAIAARLRSLGRARLTSAVMPDEVDLVLDLSGFAYGDSWPPAGMNVSSSYYQGIRKRGGSVVLMPQQLGPFDKPESAAIFRSLSASCDLIYARDPASFEAAGQLVTNTEVLHQAPDFSITLKGIPPVPNRFEGHACIVPNFKMLTQTSGEAQRAYPEFLRRSVRMLKERGIPCFVLIHERSGRDDEIARELSDSVGGLEIVNESDPLKIKGIIGASWITIGSRFHGMVNALSQGVPSLCTGWAHKYEYLLRDYGCEDLLMSQTCSDSELAAALDRIVGPAEREARRALLLERNELLLAKVEKMWAGVDEVIAGIHRRIGSSTGNGGRRGARSGGKTTGEVDAMRRFADSGGSIAQGASRTRPAVADAARSTDAERRA